jgi:hypothetical protein
MTQMSDTTPAVTAGTPVVRIRAHMARPGMRNAITTRSGGSPVSRMRMPSWSEGPLRCPSPAHEPSTGICATFTAAGLTYTLRQDPYRAAVRCAVPPARRVASG